MTGVILFLIVAAYVACILKKKQVDAQFGAKNKRGPRWDHSWMDQDRSGFDLSLFSMAHHENNDDLYND